MKGGITVRAVFNYQVSPELSTKFCYKNYRISVRNCAGIYHQWRNNKILLDAWYSRRSVRWCRRWRVRYVSLNIGVLLHMCSPLLYKSKLLCTGALINIVTWCSVQKANTITLSMVLCT